MSESAATGMEPFRHPVRHLVVVSLLVIAAFGLCEVLHWLDPTQGPGATRPEVHRLFLPHGVIVLLGWFYGWAMVPLVLPALLVCAAFVVGPEYMTPTVALLAVMRVVTVVLAFDLLRMVCCDARRDVGRRGLKGLFAVGLMASLVFNLLRIRFGPCCEVMTLAERMQAYAVAVGADLLGLLIVMILAMLVFRVARRV